MIIKLVLFLLCLTKVGFGFYDSQAWLDLLYYEKTKEGYKSLTSSSAFFISKNGSVDPKKEYLESLVKVKLQDNTFKQRFPLRYKLIALHNNIEYLPIVDIKKDLNKAMIVFPNRYMGNPASMFGHLFILLESEYGIYHSDIVHFVADASSAAGLGYVISGLSGKFKGEFVTDRYYKKIKEYSYSEDRDISFYKLSLSVDQIYELQLHIKELQNINFDYYFLEKNCAYFIAKLLNNISKEDIRLSSLIVLPSDVINDLNRTNRLTQSYFRPSATELFNSYYNNLSFKEKKAVKSLIYKPHSTGEFSSASLKTFLYVSNYAIHNFSNYDDIIRKNRLYAYKTLSGNSESFNRPSLSYLSPVKRIYSRYLELNYESDGNYRLLFNPISYGNLDEFSSLHTKKISVLAPSIRIDSKKSTQFQFQMVDILNRVAYDSVLTNKSWRLKQRFFLDSKLSFDSDFSYGLGVSLKNKALLTSFVGLTFANYNNLNKKSFKNAALQEMYEFKLSYFDVFKLNKTAGSVAFFRKYRASYWLIDTKFFLKSNFILTLGASLNYENNLASMSLAKVF